MPAQVRTITTINTMWPQIHGMIYWDMYSGSKMAIGRVSLKPPACNWPINARHKLVFTANFGRPTCVDLSYLDINASLLVEIEQLAGIDTVIARVSKFDDATVFKRVLDIPTIRKLDITGTPISGEMRDVWMHHPRKYLIKVVGLRD
ncbi:MAG: hypothetical protein JWO95_1327 [Verrucomicrobiales bacterium]|nr:hypothetical protein [Verrucomicrobiales bacterium]